MKLPLYFTGSISANDAKYLPIRKAIVQTMQEYGDVLDDHVAREDAVAISDEMKRKGINVYEYDTGLVDKAIAGVAEISTATTGGGGEIERMASQGKPLLVLHHKDTRGSWYVNDMPSVHQNVVHKTYATQEEAVALTREFLERFPKSGPGKLIVIDGTDGSGKTDQTTLLVERMKQEKRFPRTMSFPTYGKPSAKLVELYLNGEFGTLDEVGPKQGSTYYAFNRFSETGAMARELKVGFDYVLNRYTSANGGHQGGKISDAAKRKEFLDWLLRLEFEVLKIPRPDLNIFLHMPAAIGQQFVERKAAEERTYLTGGKKKDLHEANLAHLLNAEESYLYMARNYPGWKIVSCVKPELESRPEVVNDAAIPPEQKVLSRPEIHERIWSHVKEILK